MYDERLLEHFRNPKYVGELPPPAKLVEVANPACGDTMRLSVTFSNDRVDQAAFKVRGCVASIASGSALTEWMQEKTRAELSRLKAADIEALVGGLPAESKHAAVLCIDAIKALLK